MTFSRVEIGWRDEEVRMMLNGQTRRISLDRLMVLLIIAAVLLRVNRYLYGFPFWGDEAWVALRLWERSYWEMLVNAHLTVGLPTPPVGFMFVEKFLLQVFGASELALRAFPCACGVASVFLFRQLLKSLGRPRVALIALTFFGLSSTLIFYSSELKQYSSDILFVIIVYLFHLGAVKSSMEWENTFWLLLMGLLGLFFSLPIVLVLTGTGVAQAVVFCRQRQFRPMVRYLLVLAVWLLGFWYMWDISYYANYDGPQQVLRYQRPYYLSFPSTLPEWAAWGQKLGGIFHDPVDLSWPALTALLSVAGIWSFWRQRKGWLAVLLAPVLVTIILSMLNCYPFHGRYLIFLLPILYILIAQGVDYVMNECRWRQVLGWTLVAVLLIQPLANARNYVVPSPVTDLRSLMLYIRAHHQPNDYIYFNNDSTWGYFFYRNVFSGYALRRRGVLYEFVTPYWKPGQRFFYLTPNREQWWRVYSWDRMINEKGQVARLPGGGRTWILLSQVPPDKKEAFLSCFDAFGTRIDEQVRHNASLYLYELR